MIFIRNHHLGALRRDGNSRCLPAIISGLVAMAAAWAYSAESSVKRSRHDGLNHVVASSTSGAGNLNLTQFGRAFLWDNNAAQKIPPFLPYLEAAYGVTEFLDIIGGMRVVSYAAQPGSMYLRVKVTTPNNKDLRLFGIAQSLEVNRNLMDFFPSNGYRVKNEGFGPEGFIFGNDSFITSYRMLTSFDLDLVTISSYLPVKLYHNIGWEGAGESHIANHSDSLAAIPGRKKASLNFSQVPLRMGLEFKSYNTDFFAELEAEPFVGHVSNLLAAMLGSKRAWEWERYQALGKIFDIHILETPIYTSIGAKIKYNNGAALQGGISWLLSEERGPRLGSCHQIVNICRDAGASDGFSPFYPQWKVFWLLRYPLRFKQTSSELYRSFLLKRYEAKLKSVDIDKKMEETNEQSMETESIERIRKLEERRKEAGQRDVDLN